MFPVYETNGMPSSIQGMKQGLRIGSYNDKISRCYF